MSGQLDYEATKSALRAQASAPPRTTHGWRWTSAAGLVVVACAIVATVWITREGARSEVVMVPSAGHDVAAHPTGSTPASDAAGQAAVGRSTDTTATVVDGTGTPIAAPEQATPGDPATENPRGNPAGRPAPRPQSARDAGSVFVPQRSTGGGRSTSSAPGTVRPAPGQTPPPSSSTPTTSPTGPSQTNEPTGGPSPTTGGGVSDPGGGDNPSGGGSGSDDSAG